MDRCFYFPVHVSVVSSDFSKPLSQSNKHTHVVIRHNMAPHADFQMGAGVVVMVGYPAVALRDGRRGCLDSDGIATTLSKTSVRNIKIV